MLKRPYEGALVVGWAPSDQATDVCEGARAVVSVPSDLRRLSSEAVSQAEAQPKVQERFCRLLPPGPSRYDQRVQQPWRVYTRSQNAFHCSIRDAGSKSCTCIQSNTSLFSTHQGAELHADIFGGARRDVHASSH